MSSIFNHLRDYGYGDQNVGSSRLRDARVLLSFEGTSPRYSISPGKLGWTGMRRSLPLEHCDPKIKALHYQ